MRRRDQGFTLVELMVAMVLAGIAAGFIFTTYTRASVAYQTQVRVSELQQTLRSAGELLVRDVRAAGFLATTVRTVVTGASVDVGALAVDNNAEAEGSDSFRVFSSDTFCRARVSTTGPAFPSSETEVSELSCFGEGDVVLAVRIADPKKGHGCVLKVTGVQVAGPHFRLQHNPGASGQPWNEAGNDQCDDMNGIWDDGNTIITKYTSRAYRIRPDDSRGVLEMSPSGGWIDGDWVELALGIVDLQLALRVERDGDTSDADGDGDPERDWYSGDNMETLLDDAANQLLEVKVSLVARTTSEVDAVQLDRAPSPTDEARPTNNEVGDHVGVALPALDTTSRYYGTHVYRWASQLVEVRNLALGAVE